MLNLYLGISNEYKVVCYFEAIFTSAIIKQR